MLSLIDSIRLLYSFFIFYNTATTEFYTLSLHDALPIYTPPRAGAPDPPPPAPAPRPRGRVPPPPRRARSEEHTSELQSHSDLVCRLLLEKQNDAIMHLLHHHNHSPNNKITK